MEDYSINHSFNILTNFGIIIVSGSAFGSTELAFRYSYIDVDIDMENKTYDFTRIKKFASILKEWLIE